MICQKRKKYKDWNEQLGRSSQYFHAASYSESTYKNHAPNNYNHRGFRQKSINNKIYILPGYGATYMQKKEQVDKPKHFSWNPTNNMSTVLDDRFLRIEFM